MHGTRWHEVSVRRESRLRILHPLIGPLALDCQLLLARDGGQRVVLFTPPVGSNTAERLAPFHVIGTGQFTAPA
ncbi:MmyB family transcriptional regulator [Streptomyces sp. NPDC001809]